MRHWLVELRCWTTFSPLTPPPADTVLQSTRRFVVEEPADAGDDMGDAAEMLAKLAARMTSPMGPRLVGCELKQMHPIDLPFELVQGDD